MIVEILENPEYRKKLKQSALEKVKTTEWRESQRLAGEKRKNNPEFKKRIKEGMQKESYQKAFKEKCERFKKCYMTPHGAFGAKKDVSKFYQVDPAQIGYWLKNKSDQFFEITKDHYEKIKHEPIKEISEINPHPSKKKRK
jgi:hypothetical protein